MLNMKQRVILQERVKKFFIINFFFVKIILQSHVNDLLKYSYTKF